ncbi:hypothetical protein Misp01_40730 [Microtetraspora sp. NBRC 13810]|uniref:TadE family type IV pilus minor pilin n=1 Tax=Microtetraspora sp. NBRC 13810 TaxID=3030990 RepID=UPI0025562527|nr:TadE family type IV pilus minor pilin [Microtetraspora sp. NBRC 13810]GLW08943.1 hypothetical protein Misp01_40730 [Microtetraspora sp. NBRC 13810]
MTHPFHSRAPASRLGERGSVTAETAAVLPVLVVVLAAALWALAAVGAQLACADAARVGARAASRGEPLDAVRQAVARIAPQGARVTIERGPASTRVEVSAGVRPTWGARLPTVTVRSAASVSTEPGVGR